jgi:hypothetical protein
MPAGVLKGHIHVRQNLPLRHHFNKAGDVGIGVGIMHPKPDLKPGEFLHKSVKIPSLMPGKPRIPPVNAVGRGVLSHHQKFPDPAGNVVPGPGNKFLPRKGFQGPPKMRNNAEGAFIGTALGDFEISIVGRGKENPSGRHPPCRGFSGERKKPFHFLKHCGSAVGAGNGLHSGPGIQNKLPIRAEAARDYHIGTMLQSLADDIQRLFDRILDKAAGVNNHRVRILIGGADLIPLLHKKSDDVLGIHQILAAAQRNKSNPKSAHKHLVKKLFPAIPVIPAVPAIVMESALPRNHFSPGESREEKKSPAPLPEERFISGFEAN